VGSISPGCRTCHWATIGLVNILLDARLARLQPSLVVLYHGKVPLRGGFCFALRFQRDLDSGEASVEDSSMGSLTVSVFCTLTGEASVEDSSMGTLVVSILDIWTGEASVEDSSIGTLTVSTSFVP